MVAKLRGYNLPDINPSYIRHVFQFLKQFLFQSLYNHVIEGLLKLLREILASRMHSLVKVSVQVRDFAR